MASESSLFLGIDVGTGGVRALAVTQDGTVAGQASVRFAGEAFALQAGRHEQPPQAWWRAVAQTCRELVDRLTAGGRSTGELAAVAVDGTSGTLVATGADGAALRPALMYNDPRAAAEAEELNALAGDFCEKLGYRFQSSFALAKIAWLSRHEPETFRHTARFVHQADYVAARLTGRSGVSDYSNALKTGYDLIAERWPDWLDALPGVRERLPEIVPPGTVVGSITADAARQTGLPGGLPVVAGATDGTAACVASGLRRVGDYNTTLGTTLVFKGLSRQVCRDPEGRIYCHKLPEGLWLPGAASNTGAEWIPAMFPGVDPAEADTAAKPILPGKCLAYPLTRTGERFPFQSPIARGFFRPETSDPMAQYAACLVGVAFVERLAYDVLDGVTGAVGGEVFSTGAASRSDVWMRCRADATGRVLHRPACAESAFGSAALAAAGTSFGSLARACEAMVRIEKTFLPNQELAAAYDGLFGQFRDELIKRGYC